MGWQKEFQAEGDRTLHAQQIMDNVATVEELVQSQKDKPQTHDTVRETAREIGIHRSERILPQPVISAVFVTIQTMIH